MMNIINSNSWISHQASSSLRFIVHPRTASIHLQLLLIRIQKRREALEQKILNRAELTNVKFGVEMPAANWLLVSALLC